MLDAQTGELTTHPGTVRRDYSEKYDGWGNVGMRKAGDVLSRGDSGGASRFFFRADYDDSERGET